MRLSDSRVRFHIVENWDGSSKDLLATKQDFAQPEMIARIVWEPHVLGPSYQEENVLFRQTRNEAADNLGLVLQTLVVELDKAGLTATGHEKEIKVMRGWLEDMRAIAFDKQKP